MDKQAKLQQQEAKAILAMTKTAGWKVLEPRLIAEVGKSMKKLILETDELEKVRLQQSIQARKAFLNEIKENIDIIKN